MTDETNTPDDEEEFNISDALKGTLVEDWFRDAIGAKRAERADTLNSIIAKTPEVGLLSAKDVSVTCARCKCYWPLSYLSLPERLCPTCKAGKCPRCHQPWDGHEPDELPF